MLQQTQLLNEVMVVCYFLHAGNNILKLFSPKNIFVFTYFPNECPTIPNNEFLICFAILKGHHFVEHAAISHRNSV